MRMEDQELIFQVKEGDEMAFVEIVRRYKDRIVNYLWQLTGDYEKASELGQETFMRVYFKAHHYRPIAPLSSWIYAIASNLAKTDLKRARRAIMVPLENVEGSIASEETFSSNPENSPLIAVLRKALNSLHPRYRVPIILKDIEGFSQEEIAEILKKPLGTIKARISRGRDYLKKEIEQTPLQIQYNEK